MKKKLNINALKESADQHGLSQTAIAKELNITKAAVSKWFKNSSFPRPAELLKLGRLLHLNHHDLVTKIQDSNEPIVAFRKRANCITTAKHIAKAKDMGRFLTPLVEHLDFDKYLGPPSLKQPSTEYHYLQELAAKMRRDMDIPECGVLGFEDIVDCFHKYQAVIIPTLWGKKTRHENALHIHLPESQTTWIYLNLDSKMHDFKFWMAHEFGHVITIDLLEKGEIETAEDFADAFAGVLLFPESVAKIAYTDYTKARSEKGRINSLLKYAEDFVISPLSVFKEIENYAMANSFNFVSIGKPALHASINGFNARFSTVSEVLFDDKEPTADHFMRVAQEKFGTDFYKALGNYIRENEAPPNSISLILGVPIMDAHAYHEALTTA